MTINEFVQELKHKTLELSIFDSEGEFIYTGKVGEYIHSVFSQKYGSRDITRITFTPFNEIVIHTLIKREVE